MSSTQMSPRRQRLELQKRRKQDTYLREKNEAAQQWYRGRESGTALPPDRGGEH